MIDAALAYATHGWRVIPVHTPTFREPPFSPCSCGSPLSPEEGEPTCSVGKHPRLGKWQNLATKAEKVVREWWLEYPDANVGVATGQGSGVFVWDEDGQEGRDTTAALEEANSPLPETVEQTTGSGGRHRFFRYAPGLKNAVKVLPGIDLRADGGQVLAPPSIHASGNRYSWREGRAPGEIDVAPAPAWLLSLLQSRLGGEGKRGGGRKAGEGKGRGGALSRTDKIAKGERDNSLFELASGMRHDGLEEQAILTALVAENTERCQPPLPYAQLRKIAWSASQYAAGTNGEQPVAAAGEGGRLTDLTDMGNGQRFARMHRGKARFCPSHGWLVYSGKQWEADKLLAQELGKNVSRELWRTLLNVQGKGEQAAHFKWAQRSESNASIQACLTMASSEDGIRIDGNDLDQQPWLFNCANGTVDLRTGELLKHDPDHLITHLSPVAYRPEARCPQFEEFMGQIMGGSQAMVDYLQEWQGQCLSGSMALQELLMCIGNGANGKNTMLNPVLGVMGSYAGVTPADWLLVKKHDAHSQEIVMLKGKRLLLADEAEQGRAFNEALIKKFTGGSPLRGHLMGMNDIEFRPEFKVVLLANHKPLIKGTDDGIWRRPPVVPFSVKFHDPAEGVYPVKDLALDRKLAAEQEGILAWLVRGCLRWVGNDLAITRPSAVLDATREYREEMDALGNFITDRCDEGPLLKIKASHLFKAWEGWVGSRGGLSLVAFADQMKRRGYLSERTRDGIYYHGLDVRDEAFSGAEDWRTN